MRFIFSSKAAKERDHAWQKALYWFKAAATQGCADAELQLGVMHGAGHGTPRDTEQAVQCLLRAADCGTAAQKEDALARIQRLFDSDGEPDDAVGALSAEAAAAGAATKGRSKARKPPRPPALAV